MESNSISSLDSSGLARLINRVAVPMWIFNQETLDFLEVNQTAIERYGFSREEFLAMTLLDIRPSEDASRLLHSTLRHPHATIQPTLWRHQTKDGTIFQVQITSREIRFCGHPAELVCAASPFLDGEFISANKIWSLLDRWASHDLGRVKLPPCSTGAVRVLSSSRSAEAIETLEKYIP
jgi:PAS domain S-box-containing protein